MAFHIDTYYIPRIYGYGYAKELFEKTTPIRGGDQSMRRLAKRNDATKWLKHEILDGVDVYIAGLHNTDVITYYPTHYEIHMGGWDSISTRLFIEAITCNRCASVKLRDYIPAGFRDLNDATVLYDGYPITAKGRYKFSYDDKPLSDLPSLQKYKVNRKRMNEVRALAKPFYSYMQTMAGLSPEEMEQMNVPWRGTLDIVEHLQDEDKWWALFQYLSWHSRIAHWSTGNRITYVRSLKVMRNSVENALKGKFAEEVLEAV